MEAAKRLLAVIRPYDSFGRVGGEEFLAVIPQCDAACIKSIAERVKSAFCDTAFNTTKGATSVTVSIGTASASRNQKPDKDLMIAAADKALYQAKESGRNRVICA